MQRITPFDNEACVMLELLTEREVVATEMDDNFTIHAFYNKHNNPDYVSAIIDAARGRFGERFIEVSDEPEREMLKFTIAYDIHQLIANVGRGFRNRNAARRKRKRILPPIGRNTRRTGKANQR